MAPRWYTSTGDDGYTGVLGRERVPKYADRPTAYGTVDELSAVLGLVARRREPRPRAVILAVQRDLYKMMADLATLPEAVRRPAWLPPERLAWLEATINELGTEVEMPKAFVVPGDSLGGAALDVARTVAAACGTLGRPPAAQRRAAQRHRAQVFEPAVDFALSAGPPGR